MNTAPLISRAANAPLAFLEKHHDCGLDGGIVSAQTFMGHVLAVANALPSCGYVINICTNRYLFTVSFCAVILRSQVNLLPPNKKILMQQFLLERYGDCYVIHDGCEVYSGVTDIDIRKQSFTQLWMKDAWPEIALNQLSAISFTSGSTGESRPNYKTWGCLVAGAAINARYMLAGGGETLYQVATVPPQHMWGLETSVLLPLFYPVCVADTKPLFPYDIQQQLLHGHGPRMLVTTPIHLRALVLSGLTFARVDLILCATSPLDNALAVAAEQLFSTEVREVYGCSEVGSMAFRRTAKESYWQRYDDIIFSQLKENDISFTFVNADHLPEPVCLQDSIVMQTDILFSLQGRVGDNINIAGKRGSLADINNLLLRFPDIIDGVVFMPESSESDAVVRLSALVVLPPAISVDNVLRYLQQQLDDAFVPRPIIKVNRLPREENGKLSRQQLQSIYRQIIAEQ